MKTARVENNKVVEFLTAATGFELKDCYHPLIIAMCQEVSDEVEIGWEWQNTGEFKAPEPEVLPVVAPE